MDLNLELHPDKGPNAPNALAEFQALQSSFEILKDEKDRKKFDDLVRVKRDQQRLHSQPNASYHLQHNASHNSQHNADDFEARQRAAMHAKKKAKVAATAFSVPKLDQEKVLIVPLNEDGEEYTERRLRDFFSRIGKVARVLFKNRG
ncbi:uncharacterized protein [Malus domestica]|uniref:uncharacterized protein n=1 Tax=Malus domestica TaxID=3750 RepID=UPI0039769C6F